MSINLDDSMKKIFAVMMMFIVCLSAGCDESLDLSLCNDYVEEVSGNRYEGFIELTENNLPAQIPVAVNIVLAGNRIELEIWNGAQVLHSASQRYNCIQIENGTLPFIEILDSDDNIVGCITGSPLSILNYDIEVVPNATSTVASFTL